VGGAEGDLRTGGDRGACGAGSADADLDHFAMAWYFHRVNAHAAWANMAVLPLTAVLMPTSMLAVAVSYLARWLAAPFATAALWAMQGILLAVHWSGGAQLTDVRVAMPALGAIAAVAISYGLALLLARRHRALATVSVAALALAAWGVYAHPRAFAYKAHELEITAIDIGQGDSFLLVTRMDTLCCWTQAVCWG